MLCAGRHRRLRRTRKTVIGKPLPVIEVVVRVMNVKLTLERTGRRLIVKLRAVIIHNVTVAGRENSGESVTLGSNGGHPEPITKVGGSEREHRLDRYAGKPYHGRHHDDRIAAARVSHQAQPFEVNFLKEDRSGVGIK